MNKLREVARDMRSKFEMISENKCRIVPSCEIGVISTIRDYLKSNGYKFETTPWSGSLAFVIEL